MTRSVLRLQFTGTAQDEPDIAALFARPRRARALAARWRGADPGPCPGAIAAGRDRFAAFGAEELRQRASQWAQQVEVLGYVV